MREALELDDRGCRISKMCAEKSQQAGASICCNMAVYGDPRMLRKERGVV